MFCAREAALCHASAWTRVDLGPVVKVYPKDWVSWIKLVNKDDKK